MLKSRKEAIGAGEKYYFTGARCKRGHIAKRYSCDGGCVECAIERATSRYADNTESIKRYSRERYKDNPEKFRAKVKERRGAHPERVKLEKKLEYERHKESYINRARKWCLNNPEKVREAALKYYYNNQGAVYQHVVQRRTRLKKQVPMWLTNADREAILSIYKQAREISCTTGVKHHVDHIVPLHGANVSGLHVPWNLQILTAKENQSKSNVYIN